MSVYKYHPNLTIMIIKNPRQITIWLSKYQVMQWLLIFFSYSLYNKLILIYYSLHIGLHRLIERL